MVVAVDSSGQQFSRNQCRLIIIICAAASAQDIGDNVV